MSLRHRPVIFKLLTRTTPTTTWLESTNDSKRKRGNSSDGFTNFMASALRTAS